MSGYFKCTCTQTCDIHKKNISKVLKLRACKSIVTFASETWTLEHSIKKAWKRKISEYMEAKSKRNGERRTNKELKWLYKERDIKGHGLSCLGNIIRMQRSRVPRTVWECEIGKKESQMERRSKKDIKKCIIRS